MGKNVRTFAFNFWEMIAFWASSPLFHIQGSGSLPVYRHDNRRMPIHLAALDYALFTNIDLNEATASQIMIAGIFDGEYLDDNKINL